MKTEQTAEAAALRQRAEAHLQSRTPPNDAPPSADEMQRLLHELQVHQIELEMQNEELRETRAELEVAAEHYSNLYDFAPVGYFTLDRSGLITQTNLAGARMLGLEREVLMGRHLSLFLTSNSQSTFNDFLGQIFAAQRQQSCELEINVNNRPPIIVQIEARLSPDGQECHAVSVDITERKLLEEALQQYSEKLESRVAERTAEVREKDDLMIQQSRMAALGEMLGFIAHQWRQPLNVLGLKVQQIGLSYELGGFSKELLDANVA